MKATVKWRKRRKNSLEEMLGLEVLEKLEQLREEQRKQPHPNFDNIKKYADEWNRKAIWSILGVKQKP